MMAIGLIILFVAMLIPAGKHKLPLFAILSFIASAFMGIDYASVLFNGGIKAYMLVLPGFSEMANIVIDPLAAFLGLLFALGFPFGALYGHYYLNSHSAKGIGSHQFFLGLMILSMHLVLVLRHSLLFLVAWELMSLASFFAILIDRESEATIASALYYFVMMHVGAAVLFTGFGLLYLQSGSFNFGSEVMGNWVKWLLLIGFAFKAGFFPFYSWLPKAHPVAPSHLSGLMSGLMIKTGIFGIVMVLKFSTWEAYEIYILLGISLLTAFNGVIHALTESNIKRALAYSSIENIGIIGIGLSFWLLGLSFANPVMAALGFAGAMMHTLNHSLFKPLLFYLSGNILAQTHTLDPDLLGGLSKRMPHTALLFLFGTVAISALPVMNGFISEFGIFLGILHGFKQSHLASTISSVAAGGGLAFVSALALIAFTKLYSISFSGEPRTEAAAKAREVHGGMLLSPIILAVLCCIFGLFGSLGLRVVMPVADAFRIDPAPLAGFETSLNQISIILLLLILFSAILYLLKRRMVKQGSAPTWGCGYQKPVAKMQYTGTAFINPLTYFLQPLLHKVEIKYRADGYFPQQISYTEEVRDYVDKGVISFVCKALKRFYRLFDGIHNGRSNSYIIYLLSALLAMLIWVLGVSK